MAYGAGVALIVVWNITQAARIVQLQRGRRLTRTLSGLGALLVLPAAAIAVTAASPISGRTTFALEWVWSVVTMIFAVQAVAVVVEPGVARGRTLVVALYDLWVAGGAVVRLLNVWGATLAGPVGAVALAESTSLGFVFGRVALASPWALTIPVLAPLVPAVGRTGRAIQLVALAWTVTGALFFVTEYPRAVRALDSFAPFAAERVQERPRGDFALGIRILPAVNGSPSPLALGHDLALVDSLGSTAIEIVITPRGATAAALDSVARSIEDLRRDSTLLVVAMGYDRETPTGAPALERYAAKRLAALDRTVRLLGPDVLFPVNDPGDEGFRALGPVPLSWWTQYLTDAAALTRRLRPRTRVGVAASAFTPFDSALFAWASGESSPLDVVGFTFSTSYGGGASLSARFRVASSWLRGAQRPLWVLGGGTSPRIFGERAQELAAWSVVTWATSQPRSRGVILDSAGDYDALTGFRAPSGRLRGVVGAVERARRLLAESSAARPDPGPTSR